MTMVNVYVAAAVPGPGYEAVAAATRGMSFVIAPAADLDDIPAAFEEAWTEAGESAEDIFTFIRAPRLRTQMTCVLGEGWTVSANPGDGQIVEVTAADRGAAEAAFLEEWNATRGTSYELDDVAFDRVG